MESAGFDDSGDASGCKSASVPVSYETSGCADEEYAAGSSVSSEYEDVDGDLGGAEETGG